MKTDGIFTIHNVEIETKHLNPFYIIIAGCFHYNSTNHDREKLTKFFSEVSELNGEKYFLGMGDYFEYISSTSRSFIKSSKRSEIGEALETIAREDVENLTNFMKTNYNGKYIGLIGGNHYYEFASGLTTDTMLADNIKTRYLGVNSFIRLSYKYGKAKRMAIDICAHHGLGGGRTCGSSINKLQTMANSFNADILLQGHDHNRCVDYINRLELSQVGNLRNRKILLARTGSFLKSYENGKSCYAVDAMYSPSDLGGLIIKVSPFRDTKDGNDLLGFDLKTII